MHIAGKGYQHKDRDFKRLSQQVGAPRFCNSIESYQQRANYEYYCTKCHAKYIRIRKVDTTRMRCGHCNGKLRMKTIEISTIQIELIHVYVRLFMSCMEFI